MDDPAKEIHSVIKDLTLGTLGRQTDAVQTYFLEDASFVHPFVRVPRFAFSLPLLGEVNSRMVILAIYRWYRFLSPTIRLTVDSAVFDPARNLIYADIRQRFAIWFIPFYAANVRLVTVLTLVPCHVGPNDLISRPEDQLGPSYQDESSAPRYHQPAARAGGIGAPQVDHDIHVRYRIAQQEDLYQVNEWLRFVLPGLGPAVWTLWQLFSAVLCFAGALVTFPLVWYSFAKASAPSRHARSHPAQDNSDAGTPKVVIHGVESPNRTAKRAQAREPTVDK